MLSTLSEKRCIGRKCGGSIGRQVIRMERLGNCITWIAYLAPRPRVAFAVAVEFHSALDNSVTKVATDFFFFPASTRLLLLMTGF